MTLPPRPKSCERKHPVDNPLPVGSFEIKACSGSKPSATDPLHPNSNEIKVRSGVAERTAFFVKKGKAAASRALVLHTRGRVEKDLVEEVGQLDLPSECASFPNIFSPQIRALLLQTPHKTNAPGIVHDLQQDPVLLHPGLGALKCGVLTDDYLWDPEKNGGP
jgi:hypothetical protein